MSIYEKILAQHKQGDRKSNENKQINQEDRLKSYFTTFLEDGVDEMIKVIRILPALEGDETPFVEIKGHSFQNPEGKYLKFICPSFNDGSPCPFCEEKNRLYATKDPEDAKAAKKLLQRTMYVVRVLERGKEHEGVKVWRFNKDSRGSGVFDKIVDVIKYLGEKRDIFDIEKGYDLRISIKRDQNKKPTINSIMSEFESSPIHTDKAMMAEILANRFTWKDAYKVYPHEYLKIVLSGDMPIYDKDRERYVGKETLEAEREAKKNPVNGLINELIDENKAVDYSTTTHIKSDSFMDSIKDDAVDEEDAPF